MQHNSKYAMTSGNLKTKMSQKITKSYEGNEVHNKWISLLNVF
jgi:hypothetical protein